ncbi:hypothetical protein GCM10028778_26650 [Barrientosiimonas marina]|uniref:DUF4362 domain-containing protein n=1 Tax=Lentibacillus kimchii TaxID=1542911 RepID=A0ABW2UUM3_9BACI
MLDLKRERVVLTVIMVISSLILFLIVFNGNSLAQDNKDEEGDPAFEKQIENFGKKQTDNVPEDYTLEEAMANGDITPSDMTSKQRETINQFKKNVKNGNPDFIRFTQFSQTGDPITTEFQFNGELIYYRWDSTRDESGRHIKEDMETGERFSVREDYCKKLVDDPRMPYITNCYEYESYEF